MGFSGSWAQKTEGRLLDSLIETFTDPTPGKLRYHIAR